MKLSQNHMCSQAAMLLVGASFFIGAVSRAEEPPLYPGQPHINSALRELTNAQKEVANATGDVSKAITLLEKAKGSLETASKNKGTYQTTAVRLTGEAIKDLEKQLVPKAAHEIDEAIEACNKAGQTGGHNRT